MSTMVNQNILKNFIVKTIGGDKLTARAAQEYNIDADKFEEINKDENLYADLNELLQDDECFRNFAILYEQDLAKKTEAESKDKEKEKQENEKVKDKNGAGK